MPCTIKIRLVEARGLPVADRATKVADAYVDITFASFEARSSVSRKSLTPRWDEEFRFDVADDAVLQSQPIMFKVMDHDVYTTDATIGAVYVDLNCILMKDGCSVQGWYPIYDTLLGVRGELSLVIRLHYFGDINPFRESSAGVQFFSLSTLDPDIFTMHKTLGFVEELVVHADPEYSWSDSFRTSRKSNEYRQMLLYKLSSQVSTMVGKKAMELGGNAVLGYRQFFDVEGDSGMVARACGTACFILPTEKNPPPPPDGPTVVATSSQSSLGLGTIEHDVDVLLSGLYGKRSLNNDDAQTPSLESTSGPAASPSLAAIEPASSSPRLPTISLRKAFWKTKKDNFELGAHDEVQLWTIKSFTPDARLRFGGIVTARSVKFLGRMATKLVDQETRDSWWMELREEVRSHAQSLQCSHVVGYIESCTIHDDVCVLSATGTAAVVKYGPKRHRGLLKASTDELSDQSPSLRPTPAPRRRGNAPSIQDSPCFVCHIPYSRSLAPFSNMRMVRCGICGRKWVPEMLFSSTEPPSGMALTGSGAFIQARVCRQRRRGAGDVNATIVSEALPFLEYELHRQLMAKMRVLGVNSLFGFESQVQISGSFVIGIITGTGMYLPALPLPQVLRITRNIDVKDDEDRRLVQLQSQIERLSNQNRAAMKKDAVGTIAPEFATWKQRPLFEDDAPVKRRSRKGRAMRLSRGDSEADPSVLRKTPQSSNVSLDESNGLDDDKDNKSSSSSSSSDSEEDFNPDGFSDTKHPFVLEIDDETDEDLMSVLLEQPLPEGVSIYNTDRLPGASSPGRNIHLFLSMKRVEWDEEHMRDTRLNVLFSQVFKNLFASILFKLRAFAPCVVCGLKTRVALAGENIIEVVLMGMAMLDGHENSCDDDVVIQSLNFPVPEDDEDAFHAASDGNNDDENESDETARRALRLQIQQHRPSSSFISVGSPTGRPMSPLSNAHPNPFHQSSSAREWIELTPLSYVPGSKILRYLGRITLHFIKESWTVRELGGLGAFFHLFLSEAIAVVRAHVRALGGNAMLSFRLVPIESSQLYRNQVYNMISVTGDAVLLERDQSPLPVGWYTNQASRAHPHLEFIAKLDARNHGA
ncbi:hypothetical protein SPRG_13700 [Saprolegnia parasitica CBS 223.65]|uniref:C2 domain-containing protein n=1 Tax=Saprolegnia parasitica (strain CBS 223.65) TaxID=695850 RepID=A0A067C3J6_SAPPC|nr:hypothetical protein SPRG_13700 [Saprolegnia parasitica CBS 223.65]KDO21387.1 hypothetical protein SPRG_13700 [Saprolegnia parasitica CBS 223.65]|eukprot:XP_012207942.1 hypothetical protein SPRG_13700 [Saprolegnia parasitica CBS 223.65]